jgi:hypothetical protein
MSSRSKSPVDPSPSPGISTIRFRHQPGGRPGTKTGYRTWRPYHSFLILLVLVLSAALTGGCMNAPSSPVVISYSRTGGIAGFDDHLVVCRNGTVLVTRNSGQSTCTLDREALEDLDTIFRQAGFSTLADTYPAPVPGADYFSYGISYHGKTVRTETTGVPEALSPVIAALDELVGRCGRGP